MTSSTEQPWWRRTWAMVTAGVLAAGALASAVTAVLGLVLPDPDLVDKAEITSVDLVLAVPLSEYERRAGPDLAAGSPAQGPELELVAHLSSTEGVASDPATGPTLLPTDPPSIPPSTPPTSGSTSAPVSPSDPSGTVSDDPSDPVASTSAPPSESPSPFPSPSPESRFDVFTELPLGIVVEEASYRETIRKVRRAVPALQLPPAQSPQAAVVKSLIATMEDPDGEPVSSPEAARRLVRVLGSTRTERTPDGKRDPLGVLVTVNVHLEGLAGRDLGIFWEVWSQGGAGRLYDRWLDEVPVSRIRAERDDDAGALQFWAPMPKKPGEYVIHVLVKDGDRLLVVGRSQPFE